MVRVSAFFVKETGEQLCSPACLLHAPLLETVSHADVGLLLIVLIRQILRRHKVRMLLLLGTVQRSKRSLLLDGALELRLDKMLLVAALGSIAARLVTQLRNYRLCIIVRRLGCLELLLRWLELLLRLLELLLACYRIVRASLVAEAGNNRLGAVVGRSSIHAKLGLGLKLVRLALLWALVLSLYKPGRLVLLLLSLRLKLGLLKAAPDGLAKLLRWLVRLKIGLELVHCVSSSGYLFSLGSCQA